MTWYELNLKRLGYGDLTSKDLVDFDAARGRILAMLSDNVWHSATAVVDISGQREGLRRLRELRKLGFVVEKKRGMHDSREWWYRLLPRPQAPQQTQLALGLSK